MNRVTVSNSPAKVTLHYGQPVKVTLRYDQKGERGIGISNVALDEQAHLIVTYDDGKTQDAGAALGDVTSIKDGIDSTYKKIQASEANVTKLEASTKANADKAQQALQDTQSASTSGVNTINTLVSEKMTYMTSTFNSLLTRAKANIDQWERDAEDKIHTERTYSLEQIKIAHDDAMVDIERSVNKAESWAVSETTPDREPDFESPTGLSQSSRSWALYSKKKAQDAADTLIAIKDNEANVSSMKNDVEELLRRTQISETNAENSYNKTASIQGNFQVVLDTAKASANSASISATSASNSATSAASSATAARNSATAAATSATNANNSETQAYEYKTSASDSATAAASSASSASESATDARAAMNTANTAASSASTSATNASTSASNASKSEIAAKTAQAVAEKARDDANSALNKMVGAMKYVGQVDNYSDLADVTKNKGDVWNIVNADSEHGIKAGDNVAWNGTDWDNLSGVVDLSAYAEKVDYQKVITSATANGATITFNHKDGTTSTATVNNVASATAATYDGKGQKIDTTYQKTADADNKYYTKNSANAALATKVDKVSGKQLSTEDYTTAEKTKLAGVDVGANKYVLPVASATVSGGIKVGANLQIVDGVLNAVQGTVDLTPFETKTNASNTYVSKSSLSDTLVDYAKKSDVSASLTTASLTVSGETNVPTPATTNKSKTIANTEFVHGVVSDLVNGAPTALDTLQELATALGNDPNFSTTILNKIGEKESKTDAKIEYKKLQDAIPTKVSQLSNDSGYQKTAEIPVVSQTQNGYMSKSDKAKLDGIEEGATNVTDYVKSVTESNGKVTVTKGGGESTTFNAGYTSPTEYRRAELPVSGKTTITISKTRVVINGHLLETTGNALSLSQSTYWDNKTYVTAANRAGKDFYIYACIPDSGTEPKFILSANSTVPAGYTATNSRKIGGFHCECLDVETVTDENTMNGYATGDIIPYSIWDLKHRPKSSPEGMVYVEPLNIWISIYIMSWDGSKLVSAYNGVQADGTSAKPFSGTEFAEYLAKVNMRLPRYDEFVVFAKGIQECVNVRGSFDVNTTGGHYTTDNKRIVSSYGIEDCAGVIWQWLSDVFGSDFANSWNTQSNRDDRNVRGDCWGGVLRRVLAGGCWVDGANCGSRTSNVDYWSAGALGVFACRGASEPLITDY